MAAVIIFIISIISSGDLALPWPWVLTVWNNYDVWVFLLAEEAQITSITSTTTKILNSPQ